MDNKHIYIMISKTQTYFAHCIRYFGGIQYNHSSIGLDAELKELYAFSRPQHRAIFLGRLVRETLDRYTLKKERPIPVVVFKLPIKPEEYTELREMIQSISCDPEYLYNLFSVLTYPFTKGFATYKSFNCTEFVAHILKKLNYPLSEPAYRYKPDDFLEILAPYVIFEGDLREYMCCEDTDEQYFEHNNLRMAFRNFFGIIRIIGRTYFT